MGASTARFTSSRNSNIVTSWWRCVRVVERYHRDVQHVIVSSAKPMQQLVETHLEARECLLKANHMGFFPHMLSRERDIYLSDIMETMYDAERMHCSFCKFSHRSFPCRYHAQLTVASQRRAKKASSRAEASRKVSKNRSTSRRITEAATASGDRKKSKDTLPALSFNSNSSHSLMPNPVVCSAIVVLTLAYPMRRNVAFPYL